MHFLYAARQTYKTKGSEQNSWVYCAVKQNYTPVYILSSGATAQLKPRPPLLRSADHTHTAGSNPVNEQLTRRRGRYLPNTTNTKDKYAGSRRNYFYILFYCVCTSSVLVSLSSLSCILPFCFNLQHTTQTPMPRRDSNLQPQQAIGPAIPATDRPQT